mgnify:FL=1
MQANLPRLLLSVAETARALNLLRKKLWQITAPRGSLPAIHVGRRVLYSPRDVEAWIQRQKAQEQQTAQ